MKKYISWIIVLIIIIGAFIVVKYKANYDYFIDSFSFDKIVVNNGKDKLEIYQNEIKDANYLSDRKEKIEYIVIHYTGTTSDALDIINNYNRGNSRDASADYFVSLDGKIYQYNVSIKDKYSWAVGGDKLEDTLGGKYHNIVKNSNSISIEMSTYKENDKWYFKKETINETIKLVQYLMDEYDVDKDNIVRHYDVTGKKCPNVDGWIMENEKEWLSFKKSLE